MNKLSSGVDPLNVTGAHTLDLAEVLLGPIIEVEARPESPRRLRSPAGP